jgi:hypothetical protein
MNFWGITQNWVMTEFIEKIQNHGPNCKKHVIVGARIDQIKSQIQENKKFDGELRVQVHKSETMNQDKIDTKL